MALYCGRDILPRLPPPSASVFIVVSFLLFYTSFFVFCSGRFHPSDRRSPYVLPAVHVGGGAPKMSVECTSLHSRAVPYGAALLLSMKGGEVMAKLTDKQKRFCEEYLVDLNATQAAIRAGYSQKTAYRIGAELLQKTSVSEHLQKLIDERSKRTEITADRVLRELAAIAFSDRTELAQVGGHGEVNFTPTEQLSAEIKRQ